MRKSPNGKYIAFESFALSFQDTNYKIPEQWDNWSIYKIVLKEMKDLKPTHGETGQQSSLLFHGFLYLKNTSSQKKSLSHVHKKWDIDTR